MSRELENGFLWAKPSQVCVGSIVNRENVSLQSVLTEQPPLEETRGLGRERIKGLGTRSLRFLGGHVVTGDGAAAALCSVTKSKYYEWKLEMDSLGRGGRGWLTACRRRCKPLSRRWEAVPGLPSWQ